ncbi:NAD(P)/FAD-dependent oxidoreductase [Bacillus weihaiensis]|uniref:NAD(P)/FAD-dependent oxidoreductase n=1 Tax=Bacillus weihaiensis TaxID=1547283 RepID=UPI0023524494|nr:FAD-dependent oxidoreductase [Bacillus weihaiensis]
MKNPVIVIGAGMAGVMAARRLQENGMDVLLVDKGKSVGGRMATRRMASGKVDHGAQFFTVRTALFSQYVENWQKEGLVRHWFGDPYSRYKSHQGMNALVKYLASAIPTRLNAKVLQVEVQKGKVRVKLEEKDEMLEASGIIITAPAPQALEILASLPLSKEVKSELNQIHFHPCFVLMVTLKGPSNLPMSGYVAENVPVGIDRVVDHFKKGISPLHTISMYSTGEWAKELENDCLKEIKESLLEKLRAILSIEAEDVVDAQVKKWKYAEAVSPLKRPFLDCEQELPVLVAGDAFLSEQDPSHRTRIESAFLSGVAAGEEMAKRLQEKKGGSRFME